MYLCAKCVIPNLDLLYIDEHDLTNYADDNIPNIIEKDTDSLVKK